MSWVALRLVAVGDGRRCTAVRVYWMAISENDHASSVVGWSSLTLSLRGSTISCRLRGIAAAVGRRVHVGRGHTVTLLGWHAAVGHGGTVTTTASVAAAATTTASTSETAPGPAVRGLVDANRATIEPRLGVSDQTRANNNTNVVGGQAIAS